MAIHDLRCSSDHRFEVIQSFTAPLPECPVCGAATAKVPARFGLGGPAAVPPPAEAMPQTWRGAYDGNREAEPLRAGDDPHSHGHQPLGGHQGRHGS